jgi:hypothetical protein
VARTFRKDSVLVFDNGQPLRKLSELLFEKRLLIPALRQLVSSHPIDSGRDTQHHNLALRF